MPPTAVEIPLSKTKLMLGLAGCILFVLLGIWMLTSVPGSGRYHPLLVNSVGIASIIFFGAIAIFGSRKLFDPKPGLIIDDRGITDNSNASSVGLIEWADITGIRKSQVMTTKFLLIDVKDPEKYLNRSKNGFAKRLMRANMGTYKTPLSISSNTLQYNFKNLETLVLERFRLFGLQ